MREPRGTLVLDSQTGKVGEVMDHQGPRLQLRPPGGGREWEADPGAVRPLTDAEQLSIKVSVANSRARWGK
ncbi:hypothetical protein ACFP1Z_07525 [Streptomyces gamaensis]|uniref:DUF2171 domain-containing protein n=1 Tax=Streptomyces gamaensis TaxID=1763542 RepID=A0ABW0YW77_9ACTN